MKHCIAVWLLAASSVYAAPDALMASLQRLAAVQESKEASANAEYLRVSSLVLQQWNAATSDEKTSVAHRMALVHYQRARRLAASSNFTAAAVELNEEAKMQKLFGGRLEFATKTPNDFFRDLIELQAQVTAATGSDPLAGQAGYSFVKDDDGFAASRLEISDDIMGITVPEIGDEEAIALVHRIDKHGDKWTVSATRWLVVPKGKLPDVLKQATREVRFDTTGKLMVDRLAQQPESNPFQPDGAALRAARATNNLSINPKPPPTPKASEPKPTPPSEEPASTPWPVVAVLVVAVLGLLWLLLKNRK